MIKLLLIYRHKQSKILAKTLLELIKPNKKNDPRITLPTLKKNNPFFLGNLVTKIS